VYSAGIEDADTGSDGSVYHLRLLTCRRHGDRRDESILALQSLDERGISAVIDLLDFDPCREIFQVFRISCEDGNTVAGLLEFGEYG
jgi:hypothetical protein